MHDFPRLFQIPKKNKEKTELDIAKDFLVQSERDLYQAVAFFNEAVGQEEIDLACARYDHALKENGFWIKRVKGLMEGRQ